MGVIPGTPGVLDSSSAAGISYIGSSNGINNADMETLRDLVDLNHDYDVQAMEFNAAEAAKQRAWEKDLSDTAHRREVQDLIAAGLNPVLSAKYGSGASTPSGSSASGSNSSSGVIGQLFGTIINSATNMASNLISRQNVIDQIVGNASVADIYAAAQLGASNIAAQASMYNSDNALFGNIYAANKDYEGRDLTSSRSYNGTVNSANIMAQANKDVAILNNNAASQRQKDQAAVDLFKLIEFPSNAFQAATYNSSGDLDNMFSHSNIRKRLSGNIDKYFNN